MLRTMRLMLGWAVAVLILSAWYVALFAAWRLAS